MHTSTYLSVFASACIRACEAGFPGNNQKADIHLTEAVPIHFNQSNRLGQRKGAGRKRRLGFGARLKAEMPAQISRYTLLMNAPFGCEENTKSPQKFKAKLAASDSTVDFIHQTSLLCASPTCVSFSASLIKIEPIVP